MRGLKTLAMAFAILVGAGEATSAPTAPTPWTPDGAMDGGNNKGTAAFPVRVVARGDHVRAFPMARRQIDPKYTWQGRDWTVDDYMKAYNVSGVLVLKDGEIVLQRYAQGRQPTDRWVSQSVAKSVTSLLAGAAIQDGKLKLSDPVVKHLPELRGSAYDGVTVRQILTMSSGVKWNESYNPLVADSDLARYYQAVMAGKDPIADFMSTLPRANPPGSTFHYNTGETHLAGVLIARAVGMPLADYLSLKIWKPYGMERDGAWHVDKMGREFAGCCLLATLADFARIGQFALDGGVIDGKRVVPADWIAESTRTQISNGRPAPAGYGYFWWIGPQAYEASGIFGQSILVYPKDRLVIVVNSQWPKPDGKELFDALSAFHRGVHDAATAPGKP